jgi:hypothetical protein
MNITIDQLMNIKKEELKSTLEDILSGKDYLEEIEAINSMLENIDKVQLPQIESSNFRSSLIERRKEIENQEEIQFNQHILYFLLLIDYICHHHNEIPHKMSFDKNPEDDSPIFEGYFKDYLWKFQNSFDGANFFCLYRTEDNKTPLSLTHFESDVQLIRNHFLGDIHLSEFDDVLSQYMDMRQNQGG